VILDPNVLADLAVAITPKAYVRVTPMGHAATPLGAGFGVTRFASPTKAFKVIYVAQDLTTAIATGFRAGRCANFLMSKPRSGA